jgi:hypothetical protein
MKLATFVLAAAMLGLLATAAFAQTADQHNAPGGPRDRVNRLLGGLPPAPPAPTPSTSTVASPPAAPR